MPMLAELADVSIGVDTCTGTRTAAAVDRLGAHLATIEVSADAAGYARLASFAAGHAAGLRTAWAIEGCGSPRPPAAPADLCPAGTFSATLANVDDLDLLRHEFNAEDGSFLVQFRVD